MKSRGHKGFVDRQGSLRSLFHLDLLNHLDLFDIFFDFLYDLLYNVSDFLYDLLDFLYNRLNLLGFV